MVEKRFELVGVAKQSIVWNGLIFMAGERVSFELNEKDKDFYSQFIVVDSVKEFKSKPDVDKSKNGRLPEVEKLFVHASKSEDELLTDIGEVKGTTKTVTTAKKPKPIPKPKPKTTTQVKKKITTQKKTTASKTKK